MNRQGIQRIPAGQGERLTVRLNGLIRNYPKGSGILKEFIQNADDAGATQIRIVLDCRTHPTEFLSCPEEAEWAGPSLLIYNNASFSNDDFRALESIGESSKVESSSKTGKFGLGFNAAYNVTDYPSLVSRDRLIFFDPHRHHPDAQKEKPGGGFILNEELWNGCRDLLAPFEALGLDRGVTDFKGTIFRLPLRTVQHAARSEICSEPFTVEDFHRVVSQLADFADALPLFLKHILHIELHEISEDGTEWRELLYIRTLNEDEVRQRRSALNTAATTDYDQLIAQLRREPEAAVRVSYRHQVAVRRQAQEITTNWRVVGGLYVDDSREILDVAQEMRLHREKALPWAGAAARLREIDGRFITEAVEGRLFCFLPLPGKSKLPIHLNGFFDLDSSRQIPTNDSALVGKDALRVRWNKLLSEHAVSQAYADLIEALSVDLGTATGANSFDVWPTVDQFVGALEPCGPALYAALAKCNVIASETDTGTSWSCVDDLWILPDNWKSLHEPLVRQGLPLPSPQLPPRVISGFQSAKVSLDYLTPAELRRQLRVTGDLNIPLKDASFPCLRRRKWVSALLRFCLSDNPGNDLRGVPLALLCDDRLHTFGSYVFFLGQQEERELFRSKPNWFVEETFAEECCLQEIPEVSLQTMTPARVLKYLDRVVTKTSSTGDDTGIEWSPGGESDPNASWLAKLYNYLAQNAGVLSSIIHSTLKTLPIVPDQWKRLRLPSSANTPLLVAEDADPRLLAALDAHAVPRVHGPTYLIKAIRNFADAYPNASLIFRLTASDLVDTLEATQESWSAHSKSYSADIHDVLIDFLADPSAADQYASSSWDKLTALRIWPTRSGDLVCADDADVYLPARFAPPLGFSVQLLKVTGERWSVFLKRFVPRSLDASAFISNFLLPQYASLSQPKRVEALTWLLEHLPGVERKWVKEDAKTAERLRASVKAARLIECSDGELRTPVQVYHPYSKIVRHVLGDDVPYPDLTVYSTGEEQWLHFFSDLGMADAPRAQDLLNHVDRLIESASLKGVGFVLESLHVVYEHFRQHWDHFEGEYVNDFGSGGKRILISAALANRAWMPALMDDKRLARFFAATQPVERLYKPAELFPARLGNLVASQRPINGFIEPDARFRDALKFPKSPDIDIVLVHFDHVLEIFASDRRKEVSPATIRASFSGIYQYFGQLSRTQDAAGFEDGSPIVASGSSPEIDLTAIQRRYEDRPCICDESASRLWKPSHTFKSKCRSLEPRRRQMLIRNPELADDGLTVLGRRDEPSANDFVDFLDEIAAEYAETPLPKELTDKVIDVEFQLARLAGDSVAEDSVPVLCSDDRLYPSKSVFQFDTPWLEGKFQANQLHIAHDKSCHRFLHFAGVPLLSQCVEESLEGSQQESRDQDALAECHRLSRLIRSKEFAVGLKRIIRAGDTEPSDDLLCSLKELSVSPIVQLQVNVCVSRADGHMLSDMREAQFMLDHKRGIIYFNERSIKRSGHFIAKALIQYLGDIRISDPTLVVQLLSFAPVDIERGLSELEVPLLQQFGMDANVNDEPINNDDGIDFLSDDQPEMPSAEFSENHRENTAEVLQAQSSPDSRSADADSVHSDVSTDSSREDIPGAVSSHNAAAASAASGNNPLSPSARDSALDHKGSPNDNGLHKRARSKTDFGTFEGDSSSDPARNGLSNLHDSGASDLLPGRSDLPPRKAESPNREGHRVGRSSVPPRKGRVLTYLVPEGQLDREEVDPADDEQPQNMEISRAAVAAVIEYERARKQPLKGGSEKQMVHNHPGYDVESYAEDGKLSRYIEVKGIDGAWGDSGVPLSATQFRRAQELGDDYWLYVVEFARDPGRRRVHAIQNPGGRVTQFRFDMGWRSLAEKFQFDGRLAVDMKTQSTINFKINERVQVGPGKVGVIRNVQESTKFVVLHVEIDGLGTRPFWFNRVTGQFNSRK